MTKGIVTGSELSIENIIESSFLLDYHKLLHLNEINLRLLNEKRLKIFRL